MKFNLLISATILILALTGAAEAKIMEQDIMYNDGERDCLGYAAWDDSFDGKRPGVLVVHQWKGLSGHEKERARMLAEMGYVAFCADLYGEGVRPKDSAEASRQAGQFYGDRSKFHMRGKAALDKLKSLPGVDAENTAAIGFCFGGTAVLELARSGQDLKGVSSFHGGLKPDPPASDIKCSVLAMHGADDPHVPDEDVQAFIDEMRSSGADWELIHYGDAVHAFTHRELSTDNSKGAAYNVRADRRSWAKLRDYLSELFGR